MTRRGLIVAVSVLALAPALTHAADERKKGGGASFIQLQTLTATVNRLDGRRGVMTVEVGLDVPDAGLHARAAQSTPRLVAAFAEVVRIYAAGLPPGAPPNADYLGAALQRQTEADRPQVERRSGGGLDALPAPRLGTSLPRTD
jgi:hypothetical protein